MKAFHNLCKTYSKKEKLVEKLWSDYKSELLSKEVEGWFLNKGTVLGSAYSQEQNASGTDNRPTRALEGISP